MPTHTDLQLRQALAKMLPDKLTWIIEDKDNNANLYYQPAKGKGSVEECWLDGILIDVEDTELLQLCWEVEEDIKKDRTKWIKYLGQLYCIVDTSGIEADHFHDDWKLVHATWQQKVEALAKVKGIVIE